MTIHGAGSPAGAFFSGSLSGCSRPSLSASSISASSLFAFSFFRACSLLSLDGLIGHNDLTPYVAPAPSGRGFF